MKEVVFTKVIICISYIFVTTLNVFSQSQYDNYIAVIKKHKSDTTEVNALNSLFWLERNNNTEEAKKYLDKAMKLAKKINYQEGQGMSYRHYGAYYGIVGKFDLAIENLKKGKIIFEKVQDSLGLVSCINGLANIYLKQGDYQTALDYYIQTEKINSELNHKSGLAKAKHNIGTIHYYMGRNEKALEYFKSSLKIKESISDSTGMLLTWNAIGSIYSNMDHKKALEVYYNILPICIQQNNQSELAIIYNNIGAQYFFLNKLDSATYYYEKSLSIYRKLNYQLGLASNYSNLGGLMLLQKKGLQAKIYYDSSLVISQRIKSPQETAKSYEGLAQANELLGNFEDAYNYYVRFYLLNDSISGERVKQNIADLQIQYETGKKDLELAKFKQNEIQAKADAERKTYLIIGVTSLAIVLILVLILYIAWKNAKERQQHIELEQKALRAQMNPHFIFNSLNSIQRMYIEGNEDLANDFMADFSRLLRSILENSGKEKIPLREEIEITRLYLELEQLRTNKLFDFEFNFGPENEIPSVNVPPLIFQPYLENAIWHGIMPLGEKGKITISIIKHRKNELTCEIQDNGVGINQSLKIKDKTGKRSMGMEITEKRLGGKKNVYVEELSQGGTKICLTIPITHD